MNENSTPVRQTFVWTICGKDIVIETDEAGGVFVDGKAVTVAGHLERQATAARLPASEAIK